MFSPLKLWLFCVYVSKLNCCCIDRQRNLWGSILNGMHYMSINEHPKQDWSKFYGYWHTYCGPSHGMLFLVRQKRHLPINILDIHLKWSNCSSIMTFTALSLLASTKQPLPHKRWIITKFFSFSRYISLVLTPQSTCLT